MLNESAPIYEFGFRHLHVMERLTQINPATDKFEDVPSKLLEMVLDAFEADRASLRYPCDPETL